MKKLLLSILMLASPAFADIAVTQGAGKTVATTTDQSREFQQIVISTMMVNNGSGIPTPLGYITGASSMPVSLLGGSLTGALPTGTNSIGTVIIGTGAVTVAQGPGGQNGWKIDLSTGILVSNMFAGTTIYVVNPSTVTQGPGGQNGWKIDFSTGVQVNTGSRFLSVDFSTGIQVQGAAASGAADAGNPLQNGLRASSTTIPTAVSDGQNIYQAGTNIGQALVTGIPYGLTLSTYTIAITTSQVGNGATGESVLISSGGASKYTYLCGCTVVNSSTTNTAIILESPQGSPANRYPLAAQANYVQSGVWPGCENPFFRSAPNSNIDIFQLAANPMSIFLQCQYYVGP